MSIGKALTRSLKVLSRNPKSEQNRERGAAHSRLRARMSAYGTKQTSILTLNMSAFGGKADIPDPLSNVR
jgi:hypothetical protein